MTFKEENESLTLASRFINNTSCPIFLTGKAGTGKTTFLRHIVSNSYKKTIVAAPTGIAAINAGGVTLHSLFQLPFGTFIPYDISNHADNYSFKLNTPHTLIKELQMHESKRKLIRELELLIIDEVSMLRADLLDAIDHVLRFIRRNNQTFGGVQVLFIGDLQQLPPVVKDQEWQHLKNYYKGVFFHHAVALQEQQPLTIELDKIYRQSDPTFINLLNHVRDSNVSAAEIDLLNQHYQPNLSPEQEKGYIHLTTHNHKADKLNNKALQALTTSSVTYKAIVTGDFNEYSYPVEATLELKKGAQVMFLKNDPSGEQRYFNGKIGFISKLNAEEIEVSFEDQSTTVTVEKYTWENKKYALNQTTNSIEENVVGTYTHYPLKLAWAITIHKSQGLTFEKAILDVSEAFAPGQVYVALSRLTALSGLILTSKFSQQLFQNKSTDEKQVLVQTPTEALHKKLKEESARYFKEYLLKSFDFHYLHQQYQYHLYTYAQEGEKATKYPYKEWATELMEKLIPMKKVADNFNVKLNNLIEVHHPHSLAVILERVTSAKDYYTPLFKEVSEHIFKLIDALKGKTKTKAYIKELQGIELLFYSQLHRIQKSEAMLMATINNTEFSKESLPDVIDESRIKAIDSTEDKKSKKTKKESVSGETKTKINTKELSLTLFKEGKTIVEISSERNLSPTTIEGHLAYYISIGELDISQFINTGKLDVIIEAIKNEKERKLTPIKEALGQDYSYGDVKMAMAYLEHIENSNQ